MKKRTAILLCVILLVSVFTSCAAEAPETVPEFTVSLSDDAVILNGATLNYAIGALGYAEEGNSILSFINGTEFGDLAAKRLKDVQEKYNCSIHLEYRDGCGEMAYNSAVAGNYIYDMISDESYFLVSYMRANGFIDLTTVSNLDVFDESKWGSKNMLMSTMFNGCIFGVLPAAHPMQIANSILCLVIVNEDCIDNILATDPRDYFENGEWNWDTFDNCIRTYAHTDSVTNEYVYSFTGPFSHFARSLATSNGIDFFYLNSDNSFTLGYFSQPAVDAYNKTSEWYFGDTSSYIKDVVGWDEQLDMIVEGETVLAYLNGNQLYSNTGSLAYRMENFGILPTPIGPNADGPYDFRTSYTSARFTMCIPLTAKDPEISALILDRIYEPFEGYETKESVIDYLQKNFFKDRRDATFFVEMSEGDHVMYHDHYHGMSSMFASLAGGVAQNLQANESAQYEAAEKYVLPAYLTMLEYEEYFHE